MAVVSRAAGFLRLFSIFFGICAAVPALSAARASHQRAVMLGWPTAEAAIRSCNVRRDHTVGRKNRGLSLSVRCDVDYSVNDVAYAPQLRSVSRHAGIDGRVFTMHGGVFVTEMPEQERRQWVGRHPTGSTPSLHYGPALPAEPTFVGVDPITDLDPVPGSA
jgi:hypothetical protein